jgi:hypothetical protein
MIAETRRLIAFTIPIVLLSAFTMLYGLGDRTLWGDEAETALLAVNVTKFGYPIATDGKNYVTILGKGVDTNPSDVWIWTPWLDEYIAAASIALLGKSAATVRFPFALIGLISVALFPFVVFRIYRRTDVALIALLLYATNLLVVLHTRQCRYYSIILLTQLCLIHGFWQIKGGRSTRGAVQIAILLIVQFYCNYLLAIGNGLSIAASIPIVFRRDLRAMRSVVAALVVSGALALPWFLYAMPTGQMEDIGVTGVWEKIGSYLYWTHFYVMPLVVFAIPFATRRAKKSGPPNTPADESIRDTHRFFFTMILCHMFVLTVVFGPYFRYLLPLVPILMILASVAIVQGVRHIGARYGLVVALALTNVVSVVTAVPYWGREPFDSPILRFTAEIVTPYENAVEQVVAFFRKNGTPDQSIFVLDPEFPLIFHTDMKVIDGRHNPKMSRENYPDWILEKNVSGTSERSQIRQLAPDMQNHYEKIVLDVHDNPRLDCGPDPDLHVSFTVRETEPFVIYRKLSGQKPASTPVQ